jgi:hypothetical protein
MVPPDWPTFCQREGLKSVPVEQLATLRNLHARAVAGDLTARQQMYAEWNRLQVFSGSASARERTGIQPVMKHVFKSEKQEVRDEKGKTIGEGLPTLRYISDKTGKIHYLRPPQVRKCLAGQLPMCTGCPNPPTYRELTELLAQQRAAQGKNLPSFQ